MTGNSFWSTPWSTYPHHIQSIVGWEGYIYGECWFEYLIRLRRGKVWQYPADILQASAIEGKICYFLALILYILYCLLIDLTRTGIKPKTARREKIGSNWSKTDWGITFSGALNVIFQSDPDPDHRIKKVIRSWENLTKHTINTQK